MRFPTARFLKSYTSLILLLTAVGGLALSRLGAWNAWWLSLPVLFEVSGVLFAGWTARSFKQSDKAFSMHYLSGTLLRMLLYLAWIVIYLIWIGVNRKVYIGSFAGFYIATSLYSVMFLSRLLRGEGTTK